MLFEFLRIDLCLFIYGIDRLFNSVYFGLYILIGFFLLNRLTLTVSSHSRLLLLLGFTRSIARLLVFFMD